MQNSQPKEEYRGAAAAAAAAAGEGRVEGGGEGTGEGRADGGRGGGTVPAAEGEGGAGKRQGAYVIQ